MPAWCGSVAVALLLFGLMVVGCAFINRPQIICHNVDETTCQRLAADLLDDARLEDPGKQVVKLTINGSGGAYDMQFSDGTGRAVVGH